MVLGPSSAVFESMASITGLEGPLGMARIALFCVRKPRQFMNLSAMRRPVHNLMRRTDVFKSLEVTLGWSDPMMIMTCPAGHDAHPHFPSCCPGTQGEEGFK